MFYLKKRKENKNISGVACVSLWSSPRGARPLQCPLQSNLTGYMLINTAQEIVITRPSLSSLLKRRLVLSSVPTISIYPQEAIGPIKGVPYDLPRFLTCIHRDCPCDKLRSGWKSFQMPRTHAGTAEMTTAGSANRCLGLVAHLDAE